MERAVILGYTFAPFAPDQPGFRDGAAVYARTWGRSVTTTELQMRGHAVYPGWRGLVALEPGGGVVGVAYGTTAQPGQWWRDQVAKELKHLGHDDAPLHDCWVLTELAVLPEHRNRGLGARLHDAVLEGLPHRRAALSTQVGNAGAKRFYARHGWRVLIPGMGFGVGGEPYAILGLELQGGTP